MKLFRAFLLHHRRLALLLVVMALAIKAMIPDGFMPHFGSRTISIQICADAIGQPMTRQITVAQRGDTDGKSAHGKAEGLCAFTALGHSALGGADPVLLLAALLFLFVLGFAPLVPAAPRRVTFLRPPLRGPPALA